MLLFCTKFSHVSCITNFCIVVKSKKRERTPSESDSAGECYQFFFFNMQFVFASLYVWLLVQHELYQNKETYQEAVC